jgi:hypothetical protein
MLSFSFHGNLRRLDLNDLVISLPGVNDAALVLKT